MPDTSTNGVDSPTVKRIPGLRCADCGDVQAGKGDKVRMGLFLWGQCTLTPLSGDVLHLGEECGISARFAGEAGPAMSCGTDTI